MVLCVMKWDIHPDKLEAYQKWQAITLRTTLAVPGVVEFRGYRQSAGPNQAMVTYEFADMAAWAVWNSHPDIQKANNELHTFALNVTTELWGPSPNVPVPIRPGK